MTAAYRAVIITNIQNPAKAPIVVINTVKGFIGKTNARVKGVKRKPAISRVTNLSTSRAETL
jgi:hypothetical protein